MLKENEKFLVGELAAMDSDLSHILRRKLSENKTYHINDIYNVVSFV